MTRDRTGSDGRERAELGDDVENDERVENGEEIAIDQTAQENDHRDEREGGERDPEKARAPVRRGAGEEERQHAGGGERELRARDWRAPTRGPLSVQRAARCLILKRRTRARKK